MIIEEIEEIRENDRWNVKSVKSICVCSFYSHSLKQSSYLHAKPYGVCTNSIFYSTIVTFCLQKNWTIIMAIGNAGLIRGQRYHPDTDAGMLMSLTFLVSGIYDLYN